MQEVLQFKISLDEIHEVKNSRECATMILFHGEADCSNFRGKVLPGGVDTQVWRQGEKRSMSARYILEGLDSAGEKCRIFVENQGWMEEGAQETLTKPAIITDSAALKWLEEVPLCGRVCEEEGFIIIHIYKEDE